MNPFSTGAVLGELHHDIPPIHRPPIKLINGLLRLVLVLVPHKREPSRIPSPAVAGDVDVDDRTVAVEEREEVVGRRAEGDVENEEGEGVTDGRRPGAPEVRHPRSWQRRRQVRGAAV